MGIVVLEARHKTIGETSMKKQVDCSTYKKEYEGTKARLLKGDLARLEEICEKLNKLVCERDGFVMYGRNEATLSVAVHVGIVCTERLLNEQPDIIQVGLQSTLSKPAKDAESCVC